MFDLSMFGSDTISKPRKKHNYPKYVSKTKDGWSVKKGGKNYGTFKCMKTAKSIAANIAKEM